MQQTVYDFSAETLTGEQRPLRQYKGKVLLIVNTASRCGFTPQYHGLQELYEKYKSEGLVVLGFPCNQFGNQEPGNADEIAQFCQTNFGVSFPMFAKISVNGANTHPLFAFLKKSKRGFLGSKAIKWNFTKFLVNRQGVPVARYGSKKKPEELEQAIREWL